ncbi:MAG: polysaccharide export protein [Salinarimonas sp.]|nr:polysaccharide export protein [Salinarimonas sp.]
MNRRMTLALLLTAAALPGCAALTARRTEETFSARDYRLATDDRVRLIVFGQDDLSNLYTVDGSGAITVPLIGSVEVEGLTTKEAAERVTARLAGGFLREPRVTVEIDTYRPFYIMGEVARGGQYDYVAGMTVETAVAIGGGFTPRAVRSYATLSRKVGDETERFNAPIDYPLRPGDTVIVRERWF